ncbi:MAG: VOC family protein [Ornithinimicrobium sp.]|uniref:VOC family protein n=1 Tax=Ornithinimicrobium sp. TaxID=1977084 RepID=UPI003D9B378C
MSLYGGGPPGAPRARRNRQRFDLALTDGDLATEVDRLVALWATPLGGATEGRVELADPDGNEFCLNLVGQEACRRVDLRWEKSSTVP